MINLRNLADIRSDKDVTQENMANILGVSRDALARWETCLTLPSLEHIYNFAKYFNFSIDYVLGLNNSRKRVTYNDYDRTLIANNLRTLRLNANLTLVSLSSKLGVSYNAIVRYEHCKSNPSLNILYKYCKIFHISFYELCTNEIKLNTK